MIRFGLILAAWIVLPPQQGKGEERGTTGLICCGGEEVFLIDRANPARKIWSWKATDSKAIPEQARKWFRSTDECKPFGKDLLITSSSGGVALVRRSDKTCRFLAYSRNAHSACLLPGDLIAVASSFGGDRLEIFDRRKYGVDVKPVVAIPLPGAHGVVWDAKRKRLWALGDKELLLVEIRFRSPPRIHVDKRWKLPTPGGHDLRSTADHKSLFVTTNKHAYRFHRKSGAFTPLKPISDSPKVKSVDPHLKTGEIVYHQGTKSTWWSDVVRFVGGKSIRLRGERLYKVRWDQPAAVPKK